LVLACALSTSCHGTDYRDPIKAKEAIQANTTQLERYIEDKMHASHVEKVSVAIFSNDQIIYSHGFNAGEDEQFQAASISKPVAAYAALRLVEQGKLELDRPLSEYLEKRYFDNASGGNDITLRMVLNHTSGMSNDVSHDDRKVYRRPGKEFHYSGAAFEYLKTVIENIVAMPFDEFMKKEVFDPLGMKNSHYLKMRINGEPTIFAAGGLSTTPTDLSRFFMELLNPKFISKSLIDEMLSDSVKLNEHNYWGLGIAIQHGNGQNIIWHGGINGDQWRSLAYVSLDDGIGMVILAKGKNGYYINPDIVHEAVGGSSYGLMKNINDTALP
jgi:CubicO group peptidase (beta-lactamase class C family)